MNAIACCFANAMESEAAIIAQGLRRRDPELLDRLIQQYQHRLFRYLLHLAGNRELAEDLFQETWIRVLERGHQYDSRHEFSTWLYAVARNLALDYLRKRNPVSLDELMAVGEHQPFEPADSSPSAWEVVAHREESQQIGEVLARIPAQYREAIVLRFYDAVSLEEIALITRAPVSTVKSRVYRGLNLLLEELKRS